MEEGEGKWTGRQETQAHVQDCLLTGGICLVVGPQFPHLLREGRLLLRTLILPLAKPSVASKDQLFCHISASFAERFRKNKAGRCAFIRWLYRLRFFVFRCLFCTLVLVFLSRDSSNVYIGSFSFLPDPQILHSPFNSL